MQSTVRAFLIFLVTVFCFGSTTRLSSKEDLPLISVHVTFDPFHHLRRLLDSIDTEVGLVLVQVGTRNNAVMRSIMDDVDIFRRNRSSLAVKTIVHRKNYGCAYGWNIGFMHLLNSSDSSWLITLNHDVAFYPGSLSRFIKSVNSVILRDGKFGIGFTGLCCGGEWSAFAVTKRLVQAVGFVDENFYPAYWEDQDYGVRIYLAKLKAWQFSDVQLLHGNKNGSEDYVSGTHDALAQVGFTPSRRRFQKRLERGIESSKSYLVQKWGFIGGIYENNCKTLFGINEYCPLRFRHPFNNKTLNASYWALDLPRRRWIDRGGQKPFKAMVFHDHIIYTGW